MRIVITGLILLLISEALVSEEFLYQQCSQKEKEFSRFCKNFISEEESPVIKSAINSYNQNDIESVGKLLTVVETPSCVEKTGDYGRYDRLCHDVYLNAVKTNNFNSEVIDKIYFYCDKYTDKDHFKSVLKMIVRHGKLDFLKKLHEYSGPILIDTYIVSYSVLHNRTDLFEYLMNMVFPIAPGFLFCGAYSNDIGLANVLEYALLLNEIDILKRFIDSPIFNKAIGINLEGVFFKHKLEADARFNSPKYKASKEKSPVLVSYSGAPHSDDLVYHPLFVALSGITNSGQIFQGSSLEIIQYLVSKGAVFSETTMKYFSPYSLVDISKRSDLDKNKIKEYLKSLKIKDVGKKYKIDWDKKKKEKDGVRFFYIEDEESHITNTGGVR
jgi:hypothetical protein